MSIWNIMKREIRQIFVLDPRRILFIFIAGVIYFLLFGGLYMPQTVKHIPMMICDEDQSAFSRSLVRHFEDAEDFQIIGYTYDPAEAEESLRDKEAYAVLEIPRDFSRKIKTGEPRDALMVINGSNILITSTIALAGENILYSFSDQTAAQMTAARTGENQDEVMHKVSPVSFQWRVLNNPVRGYLPFFVIGLAMTAFQAGMFLEMGASVHAEFRRGSGSQNIQPGRLLWGKFILHWFLSFIAFGAIIATAVWWGGMRNAAPLWMLLVMNGCFSFAVIGLGMTVSAVFPSEFQFVRAALFYAVPSFIMSGYTWPTEAMNGPVLWFSYLFPLTWMSNALRNLLLSGAAWDMGKDITVLLLMGGTALVFLPPAFRHGMKKHGMTT